ncbi:MFS transporter, UMF1 family [Geoalkalibacter ferrihydriticus]|uniref:ABC transporter permease n=2 Tax=Geoalkalibacter ferrihydriticus TaxID=392333 RepID=A0A0C2ED48_9BACT|nr:MFS transporter [Geoalkalibacter ferrihydriticus]KIH76523.1 ABC transporter permease [Geoalkalibacter ferrihydriticus DSM 17813]SDL99531.1 MFS transporter, UMF1 family [Geoalkalibacter ferrihydriticus]
METEKASKKEIFGWAMFDFANQGYTLLIITVFFGDIFTRIIVGDAENDYRLGNLLWSIALSLSYLLVVFTGPVFGAIMDFTATRKRFLFASYLLTVFATAALYFVAPGYVLLGMVLLIVSNYAYAIGESFIASFLPDLGRPEDLGKISGFGWALGYVGGLVATAFALLFLGEVSEENFSRIRWVGPFAAGFFLVAAIPTFLWLNERGRPRRLKKSNTYLALGLRRAWRTCKGLREFRDLAILMGSIFFAMCGIYIIIAFTFIYGAQVIAWDEHVRVLMFVVVQITATLGALGFGFLQDRIGAKLTYALALALWIVAITLIYLTPALAAWGQDSFGVEWQAQYVFLVVGVFAGTCLGSTQSGGRALVGLLSPKRKAAELFGFWGLFSKAAAIVGLIGIGLLQAAFGLQASILFCVVLFGLALLVVLGVDEARGRKRAQEKRHQE